MHASGRCETRIILSTGLTLFRTTSLRESENENKNENDWVEEREGEREREREREREKDREVERSWRLRFAAPVSFLFAG
jgi:hypothetical protein